MTSVDTYATFLKKTLEGKTTEEQGHIIDAFVGLLRSCGQEKMLPQILVQLEETEKEDTEEKIVVTYADKAQKKRLSPEVREDLTRIGLGGEEKELIEQEDSLLIGGYRIETLGYLIDRTHKRALMDLYRKLIS